MRLTVYTDYSLRMLMYLAVMEGRLTTISEVADAYGIAKNHLNKVSHQLGLAGFVETLRGKGGGLRLGKPAASIGLGDIIRTTEPDMALVPCFGPVPGACAILPACGLHGVLHEAREAFLTVLDRYSLADLVKQRTKLAALLQMR